MTDVTDKIIQANNAGPIFQKVYGVDIDDNNNIVEKADIGTEGNLNLQQVNDENNRQLLTNILKQLKIMNLHLSIMSDNTIKKTEVE